MPTSTMSHLENGDIGETGLLPVNQKLHRDWVGIFAGVMYLLVFMLMFWAKLKSLEAVLRSFLVVIFLVYMNAEFLLGHMRFYKTLRVFHKRLLVEYFGSAAVTLAFLVGGPVGTGALPCAITAGIYASAAIFFGAHLHPAVTLANYACHHNSLLPIHATSFVGVQMLGSTSAALIARLLHLPDATESFLTDMGHHLADVPWYDVMFVEIVYTAIIMGLVKLSNTQMATKFTTALALSLPPLLRIGYGAYSGIAGAPLDHSDEWKGPMLLLLNPCVEAGAALYAAVAEEEFATLLLPRVVHAIFGCILVSGLARAVFGTRTAMKKIA